MNLHAELAEAQNLEYLFAKQDLGLFVQAAWEVLEPNVQLKWNWHHDLICEYLEACASGQIRRLIINIAPRSTKSMITTICFPAWVWAAQPSERFLFGSYADSLAKKHSVLRRNLIESDWYQNGYGDQFSLASDVNTKSEFRNDKTGQMKAAGIKGSVIGEGGDYVIVDDPHNPKGAESELDRESTIQNFDLGWSTRLNNKKTGRIIIIMQRLHENDLTGHILSKELGYTHVKIPTIAEERGRIVFPISQRIVTREAGDYMHSERDGKAEIDQAKIDLGPYGFSGQHQQSPSPAGGSLFKESMFDMLEPPEDLDYTFIMADTAYSDKKTADFTVFTAFGVKKNELHILDVYRKQINSDLVEADVTPFIQRFAKYGFRGAYIEPKGHGIYLNQAFLKKEILVPSPDQLKEFYRDRRLNKVERANNAVPHLANRKIHMNSLIEDKEILLSEALRFPKAKHDDFVDTLIDGVRYAFGSKGVGDFTPEMAQTESQPVISEESTSSMEW